MQINCYGAQLSAAPSGLIGGRPSLGTRIFSWNGFEHELQSALVRESYKNSLKTL